MARKLNYENIRKIIRVLEKYPSGIWFRQLARETNLPVSTLHFYLKKLSGIVESVGYVNDEGKYVGLRIVRLKRKM
jgi:DNA-binding IclR family transcriptional regulator